MPGRIEAADVSGSGEGVSRADSKACTGCSSPETELFEISFAYQPIVDVSTRSIFAHEALVRGMNGESAQQVLARVTEQNRYKFDQLCRVKAVEGAAMLGMREKLSINFLPNAIYRPEVCIRSTFEAAKKYGFPINQIIFEVTEGEKVDDRPHLVNIIRQYREFGFLTAIDDFGAGFAGLNLLAEYQPNIVKIDMDLVRDVDKNPARQAIVKGIIGICGALNITVLAEGIETTAERDFLMSAGVNLMQGFLFCKPVFRGIGTINEASWPA